MPDKIFEKTEIPQKDRDLIIQHFGKIKVFSIEFDK